MPNAGIWASALIRYRLAAKTVAPALDVTDRRRREVHCAAQGICIAVALEKPAPRRDRLGRIVIDPHHKLRIARLDRRVDQIAGEHRLVAAAPGADRKMIGRVAGGWSEPD